MDSQRIQSVFPEADPQIHKQLSSNGSTSENTFFLVMKWYSNVLAHKSPTWHKTFPRLFSLMAILMARKGVISNDRLGPSQQITSTAFTQSAYSNAEDSRAQVAFMTGQDGDPRLSGVASN